MTALISIAYVLLSVAVALFMVRLAKGPTIVDRIIALDGVIIAIVGGVLVESSRVDSGLRIDTVLVIALLSFVGTGVLARYVEQRGTVE